MSSLAGPSRHWPYTAAVSYSPAELIRRLQAEREQHRRGMRDEAAGAAYRLQTAKIGTWGGRRRGLQQAIDLLQADAARLSPERPDPARRA